MKCPSSDEVVIYRNQDYYDNGALNPPANEDVETVETRIDTNLETIDGPSVSEPDVLRQGALDVPGLQYNLPSVSSHAYSNTTQPSAMDDTQGNTQPQHLSPFSSLLVHLSFYHRDRLTVSSNSEIKELEAYLFTQALVQSQIL